jgi:hypothetical protein
MRAPIASILVLLTIPAAAACSSDEASHAATDAGATLDSTAVEAGDDAGSVGDAAPTQPMVRFAQLSPDAPPLDVCLAPHGTGMFAGPLLEQLAEDAGLAPDANAPGLSFADVSAYFAIDAGSYDVRLVPAGSTTCAQATVPVEAGSSGEEAGPGTNAGSDADAGADGGASADPDASAGADAGAGAVGDAGADANGMDAGAGAEAGAPTGPALPMPPDTTNLPAFASGTFTTVLLAGDLAPVGGDAPFRLAALRDDNALAGGAATLRAINALPAVPEATFGFGSSAGSWSPLFADVAFAAASLTAAPSQGMPDANGYLPIAPFGPGAFSVRASGDAAADVVSSESANVSPGAVATILAAGGKTGDAAHPPVLVLCVDNAPSSGPLSVCDVLP